MAAQAIGTCGMDDEKVGRAQFFINLPTPGSQIEAWVSDSISMVQSEELNNAVHATLRLVE